MSSRCSSLMLIGLLKPCNTAANILWSTEQRQKHIRRNNERMRSLGLHILAQTASRGVINNQPKQKRPAKPKERPLQRSYCLRNQAKPAVCEPQQAQSSQVLPAHYMVPVLQTGNCRRSHHLHIGPGCRSQTRVHSMQQLGIMMTRQSSPMCANRCLKTGASTSHNMSG